MEYEQVRDTLSLRLERWAGPGTYQTSALLSMSREVFGDFTQGRSNLTVFLKDYFGGSVSWMLDS